MDFYNLYNSMSLLSIAWLVSIVAVPIAASSKGYNALLWILLALIFGPLALLIVVFLPDRKEAGRSGGLEERVSDLEKRLWTVENILKQPSSRGIPVPEKPQPAAAPEPPAEPPKPVKQAELPVRAPRPAPDPQAGDKHPDLEQKMGRYWLNRIGIVVLAMGLAFLISYAFKYFGPSIKIITGFVIAAVLFTLGIRLEKKEKFVYFGRTLLGGAWAIAYFTTYSMYHFPASRVINSQLLDLVLLAAVAIGMLLHSLKYRSQELSSIALFVGYFTATMGDINYFTLVNCLFLAAVSVILVYRMRWIRMIFVGIALTYLTHIFWVVKQVKMSFVPVGQMDVSQVQFWLNNGFVFLYWLVFTVSIYLIKGQSGKEQKQLAVADFSNFLPFFVLAYSKIYVEYPGWKFPFVLGLGIVYAVLALVSSRMKNRVLSTVNTLIALTLVTFAVPLRTMPLSTTVIWLFELPCIIYIGRKFGKKSFRIFALLLSAAIFVRIATFDFTISRDLILLIGVISSYLSVFVGRRIKEGDRFPGEKFLSNAYSLFGTIYLTTLVWNRVPDAWLGAALFEETFFLAIIAFWLKDNSFKLYSYLLLAVASFVLFLTGMGHNFIWIIAQVPLFLFIGLRFDIKQAKIIALVSAAALFAKAVLFDYRLYYTVRIIGAQFTWKELILFTGTAAMFLCDWLNRRVCRGEEPPFTKAYSALGAAYLTFLVWSFMPLCLLTMAWAVEMAVLLLAGCRIRDPYYRLYSLVLLVMVAVRMVFVDGTRGFDAASWAAFAAEIALIGSAYFLYKNLGGKKELVAAEKDVPAAVFTIGAIAATAVLFEGVERNFVSLAFGVEGAVMFATGFMARDRVFRIGGFGVFGLTLLRIILVDMAHVAVIYKIISFMILGAIFLVTSFLYNKYNVGKDK